MEVRLFPEVRLHVWHAVNVYTVLVQVSQKIAGFYFWTFIVTGVTLAVVRLALGHQPNWILTLGWMASATFCGFTWLRLKRRR